MRRDLLQALSKRLREPMPEGFTFNIAMYFCESTKTGCAMYLASTMPEFRAAGLRQVPHHGAPVFRDYSGSAALSELLGIDWEVSYEIFNDSWYMRTYGVTDDDVTPVMVADRIDAFLAANPEGE